MYTVILDYIARSNELESTSIIVDASDEHDADDTAIEILAEELGGMPAYVAARCI